MTSITKSLNHSITQSKNHPIKKAEPSDPAFDSKIFPNFYTFNLFR